ncbi:excisionase family DNA-binding protein [Acidobacteria bacterium AH-259-O06]|nr:excisionase family DNA-binding protein [Acidobacteria bacterium AH-259-O06]
MKTGHSLGTAMPETPVNGGSAEGTSDHQTNVLPRARLLDYKAAGAYMSLSYWSLRELVLNGEIPHLKFGKKVLIDRRDLDDWIESRKEQGVF